MNEFSDFSQKKFLSPPSSFSFPASRRFLRRNILFLATKNVCGLDFAKRARVFLDFWHKHFVRLAKIPFYVIRGIFCEKITFSPKKTDYFKVFEIWSKKLFFLVDTVLQVCQKSLQRLQENFLVFFWKVFRWRFSAFDRKNLRILIEVF